MRHIAILTRPDGRNDTLAARLCNVGWQALVLPALEIHPLDTAAADLPLPQHHDLVVFVSGNAARLYLRQLAAAGVSQWPAGTLAATVGPASAQALREAGEFCANTTILHPPASAPAHDSEALWRLLSSQGVRPQRVLLVRGTRGRDWLADRYAEAGSQVLRHAVYRRQPAEWSADGLRRLRDWADQGAYPTWLLTSSEGIAAVQAQVGRASLQAWWCSGRFIITHPALEQPLRRVVDGQGAAPVVKICMPADEAIFQAFVVA